MGGEGLECPEKKRQFVCISFRTSWDTQWMQSRERWSVMQWPLWDRDRHISLLKKIARHIAVYRCLSQLIAGMSSQGCREIAVKTTVANATRIQRLSAVACCVRVVMSRLDNCRTHMPMRKKDGCIGSARAVL